MSSPGEALCTLSNRRPEIEPLDNKIGARSRAVLGIATFIAVAAPQTVPSRGAEVKDNVRPLIAGNWKMNGLTPQLGEIEAIAASVTATAATRRHSDLHARDTDRARSAGRCGSHRHRRTGLPRGDRGRIHRRHQRRDAQRCRRLLGHRRTFGAPPTSWRDRRDGGGEGERRMARGTSGHHLHRRDAITAQRRQRLVRVRRSDRGQPARRSDLICYGGGL